VAAVYSVLNAKANIIGNMPFTLTDMNTGEEYDSSKTWQNKIKFLPQPSELFRIDTLSYSVSNAIYNIRTTDALGYKTKRMINAIPHSFNPVVVNGELQYIERTVNGKVERYAPDDKRLFRMWRLDHTTELLPSVNTEAKAMMNAAGIVYSSDTWIKHFFERGGVPPTLVMMKGAVSPEKKDNETESWGNWLLRLGRKNAKSVRVVNADALDVKQFGSSVTDLKNNPIHDQALRDVASVINAPLSMLFPDSNKYGVAKSEEKATWFDVYIIPFCKWLEYGYNEQVFNPMGKHLRFMPETLDPQQEDESARANQISAFNKYMNECATFELFIGQCDTFGYELTDGLIEAAKKFYEEKAKQPEPPVVVNAQPEAEQSQEDDTEDEAKQEDMPAKWIPNLDQIRELQRWQELAFRKFKRGDELTFEWRNDTLPDEVYKDIKSRLAEDRTWNEDKIKTAFFIAELKAAPVEVKSDILELAKALNKLADSQKVGENETKM
jgi:hypothetical protein